jgi:type IV pilus assembly protein PilN
MALNRSNLFPHRVAAQKRRLQRFVRQLIMTALLVLCFGLVVQTWTQHRLEAQNARNRLLQTEITRLGADLPSPEQLRQVQLQLSAKQAVLQALAGQKGQAAQLLKALASTTPAGVQLLDVQQSGTDVYVMGVATAHERVATFMRRLRGNGVFEQVELKEVQTANESSGAAAGAGQGGFGGAGGGGHRGEQSKLERFTLQLIIKNTALPPAASKL